MDAVRLRARTTTEIVDAAFSLYRQQPLLYILAAAAGNVPNLVASLLLQTGADRASVATSGVGLLVMILSIVMYGLMSAVVMQLGSRAYLGESMDLAGAIRAVWPRVGSVIAAGIVRSFLYGIGLILLIVPFFYFLARYFAVIPIIALEGKKQPAAFVRSNELSQGRKMHILSTLVLVWIIFFAVSIGAVALFSLVAGGSPVLSTLITTIITVAVYPILALTEMVLYYDTRIRAEGFDLERMAADLGSTAPTAGALPG